MHRCSGQYVYVGFSRRKILQTSAYMIAEKTIRFRHLDYNPDQARKLISSSTSQYLTTCNISSKSMHAFLSNLANRQIDRQTRAYAFTSSFVRGNYLPAGTVPEISYILSYYYTVSQKSCSLHQTHGDNFVRLRRPLGYGPV